MSCNICGSTELTDRILVSECQFNKSLIQRRQCACCDVIFGPQYMIDMNNIDQEYEKLYKHYVESSNPQYEIAAFEALRPQKSQKYLNYGAGTWTNTASLLRKDGWQVYNYDPYVCNKDFLTEEELNQHKFHGIFTTNVIEHFQNPVDDMKKINSLLEPGSLVCHATAQYEYKIENTRFHLYFYVGKSMSILSELLNMGEIDEQRYGNTDTQMIIKTFRIN